MTTLFGTVDDFLAHIYRWFDAILEALDSWPKWPDADELEPTPERVRY
jgi:hypothetical protein